MPELTCTPAPTRSKSIDTWGDLLVPDPDLKMPTEQRSFVYIHSFGNRIKLTKFDNVWESDERRAKTIDLSIVQAYQLRDTLNKNLDKLAWDLAEMSTLNEDTCKVLAKFKKVYYEDEINNTETNNPEAPETEAKVSE